MPAKRTVSGQSVLLNLGSKMGKQDSHDTFAHFLSNFIFSYAGNRKCVLTVLTVLLAHRLSIGGKGAI